MFSSTVYKRVCFEWGSNWVRLYYGGSGACFWNHLTWPVLRNSKTKYLISQNRYSASLAFESGVCLKLQMANTMEAVSDGAVNYPSSQYKQALF